MDTKSKGILKIAGGILLIFMGLSQSASSVTAVARYVIGGGHEPYTQGEAFGSLTAVVLMLAAGIWLIKRGLRQRKQIGFQPTQMDQKILIKEWVTTNNLPDIPKGEFFPCLIWAYGPVSTDDKKRLITLLINSSCKSFISGGYDY